MSDKIGTVEQRNEAFNECIEGWLRANRHLRFIEGDIDQLIDAVVKYKHERK